MKPRAKAMDLLARREYGFKELCERLTRHYELEDITPVVAELADEGLQSDERYVEGFVRYKAKQGYGPHYIAHRLQQTIMHEALIDQALASYDWVDCAKDVVLKKSSRTSQQLYRYMQAKGFPFAVIKQAIDDLQGETNENE